MKKILFTVSFLLIAICILSIAFVSSSKSDPYSVPYDECEGVSSHANWESAEFSFSVDSWGMESFRTQGNQSYFPQNDHRHGVEPSFGGGAINQPNYYLIVEVTSTSCSNSQPWTRAFSPDDMITHSKMRIKLPPNGLAFNISATYYEVSEYFDVNNNFNKPESEAFERKQLKYKYEDYFMTYSSLIIGTLKPLGFTAEPWGGESGKDVRILDYQGINDFLDANTN